MTIKFTGRKLTLKDSFKELAEKKLSKIGRYFSDDTEAHVTVTAEKNRQTVEVTIRDTGVMIRGEETCSEMEEALDRVIDILSGQIRKHKTKLDKKLRSGSLSDLAPAPEEEKDFDLVRNKTFPIKPLFVDEAILQMNLLGHQFFVFENPETMKTNVVYKRKNGGYGLLQPEDSLN